MSLRIAPAAVVRAAMAHQLVPDAENDRLGDVVLHPHQRDGVARARRLLLDAGGVLIADDVGLGKTFTALGVARSFSRVIVVAPASLRSMWSAAAARAGFVVGFHSVESLSVRTPAATPDLVIVDEAHHLRNPATKRYRAAAALCAAARVLLLTATPVQNRVEDLRSLLSLFLGEHARAASEEELGRYVIRRDVREAQPPDSHLPSVSPPIWLPIDVDSECLERIQSLPRAVPPRDSDDGGALLTWNLVRLWASSAAALTAALRVRIARGCAMLDGLAIGRLPSRAELTAWTCGGGSQQLVFPELVTDAVAERDADSLRRSLERHVGATRELLAWVRSRDDPDMQRSQHLIDLLARHDGERIIAFSEFAETVAAMFRLAACRARAAMLTHAGGRVIGGRVSRNELIARFAPGSAARAPAAERIDLLLCTDLLSEGVDLHDASVVVHLDLSWNPARLLQRVGRVRRLGSTRASVSVYAFRPPGSVDDMLALERRLRSKTALASRMIGVAGRILPGFSTASSEPSAAKREERISQILRGWRVGPASTGVVSAVQGARAAALASIRGPGGPRLVAILEDRLTTSRAVVADLLEHADGEQLAVSAEEVDRLALRLLRWLDQREVTSVLDVAALHVARARRGILQRVSRIADRAPAHRRPSLSPLLAQAREVASAPLSAGAERILGELLVADLDDAAWLRALGEFGTLQRRSSKRASDRAREAAAITALLILRPHPRR